MADPSSPTGVGGAGRARGRSCADEQTEVAVDVDRWARLATGVLRDEARARRADAARSSTATRSPSSTPSTCGQSGPTDVLSFPLDADRAVTPRRRPDVARRRRHLPGASPADRRPEHAGTLDDELALLVVHGVLHVLGHDHAEPRRDGARCAPASSSCSSAHHWHGPAPAGFRQEQADR